MSEPRSRARPLVHRVVNASSVMLAQKDVAPSLSARNKIAGTVVRRTDDGADSEVTVDIVDQIGQPGGHVSGPAEAGQAVQGAAGPDEVADLFAELGRRFQVVTSGRKKAAVVPNPRRVGRNWPRLSPTWGNIPLLARATMEIV